MSLYVNRLRYGYDAPTIGASSGIVNNGYYKGKPLYEDDWQPEPEHDYSQDYFTIESLEDGNVFNIKMSSDNPTQMGIYYSLDDGTSWKFWSRYETPAWHLDKNEKIMIKCNTNTFSSRNYQYRYFTSTKTYNVYGNIMSLLYGDNFVGQTTITSNTYVFNRMFLNSTYIVSAENLILPPSMVVGCYQAMFMGCTSLTNAPKLPATLENYCYGNMFYGCTSLTTAPELLTTILVQGCYYQMFKWCTSLNKVTCLATDRSASDCTGSWLNNVSSTGTFIKNPSMSSWPSGNWGIPSGWTVQDYVA